MIPVPSLDERLRGQRAARRQREGRRAGRIYTAAELLQMDFPAPKCIVKDIIVEGLGAFASRPKVGKSWDVFGIGLAVATGGKAFGSIDVEQGEALLLMLEDTERRLQDRLGKLLHGEDPPSSLHLVPKGGWPRLNEGGLDQLHEWLTAHPSARYVALDTLAKVLPKRKRGDDAYETDYAILGDHLQTLAVEHHVALEFTHHLRKPGALDGDWLDDLLGSTGISAAVDGARALKRARGQHDAVLHVTGRDLEEQSFAVTWSPQTGLWTLVGNAADQPRSRERAEILDVLRLAPSGMGPAAVAKTLARDRNATKWLMYQMWQDGELVNQAGTYSPRDGERE
jgi:hypothetical protein